MRHGPALSADPSDPNGPLPDWGGPPPWLAPLLPASPARRARLRLLALRVLVFLNLALGTWYLSWRWGYSLNRTYWLLAILLVAAETYSYVDAWLFGLTMWRWRWRGEPPPPPADAAVDVFITCYNEPVELVRKTTRAAVAIRYPHITYVLDDGNSPAMRAMAAEEGARYIVRGEDWQGHARHAKAGNLNNALGQTQGEFVLILDADQIPSPAILDRTLGYFAADPRVAFVQTPQWFYNVPASDPIGCQAPLFYGPIQQGKDGWNAAFFCGSNGILRREALMQIGLRQYAAELGRRVRLALDSADEVLRGAERHLGAAGAGERTAAALAELRQAVGAARRDLAAGTPIQEVTWRFQRRAADVSRLLVADDLARIRAELADVPGHEVDVDAGLADLLDEPDRLNALVHRESSPLAAVGAVRGLLMAVDVDRSDEAQPVMPMSTISVTEDMATAMRLHAMGWRSVYHNEILARGLAPDDLGSSLQQRLRWAQGTLQVLLRENPLAVRGLALGQRLMYLATMWSYLSGPFTAIYLAAPVVYLAFGWLPVTAYSRDFFMHLLPYLIVNQVLFLVVGWRLPTWRGMQYSLALFPLWIRALWTAVGNVYFGRPLGFVVTPKTRRTGRQPLRLITWQLATMAALVLASLWAIGRLALGYTDDWFPVTINLLWVIYDLVMLSVVVEAIRYVPAGAEEPEPDGLTAAEVHGRAMAGAH
jgi:cellulose synthase (UDP-forming)